MHCGCIAVVRSTYELFSHDIRRMEWMMVGGEKGRSNVYEKRLFAQIFLCWVSEDKTQLLPSSGLYPCWGVKWEMKAGSAAVEYVTVCHQNGRDPGG